MTQRIASLPMYDVDRNAVEAWWRGVAKALRTQGLADVPSALAWPSDLNAHWHDPRLLLSQSCGYPLVTTLMHKVQVVGAFRYSAPGCVGIQYRSELVARCDDADSIAEFRGRAAAVNAFDSHSGSNALRGFVAPHAVKGAFFGRYVVSGSHRKSLEAVQGGSADVAAIDCITLAGLRRHVPGCMNGLRVIGSTSAATGLPLVTAAGTSASDLLKLRSALERACIEPALADVREALFIGGFQVATASAWRTVGDVRRTAGASLVGERFIA